MALSQIQCLDDNHVNWRVNESKSEFFYSEQQRLALEALVAGGRDAFCAYVKERELRPFLSEPELERLCRSVEDYRPGAETSVGAGVDEEARALSLQYWPDRSDVSVPVLDLGWPDTNAYRGVTRVNVYTQPPVDGQTHIKEVVRKAVTQAQKTIAIVMDVFTDIDIFKDLLDAGFKRRVAVYIILEQASVPDFLHMCERAGMHGGHLKNLRVRCTGGSEFLTRSARKVQGSLSQKFMFVDGDRAISGSYSFTWMASRLDRNIITVLTGQAVETFDKQFRELYFNSQGVCLSKVPLGEVPEPDPIPAPAPAAIPSAAIARKLINPKYALVDTASRTSSDKNSENCAPEPIKRQRDLPEEPPKHPGLVGLLRADLISYLPTWPEPDPPSDVIGFINIRDTSKPAQPHLMRSQLFETSQAIRFKDPFTAPPEDPLPEKACPRNRPRNDIKNESKSQNDSSADGPLGLPVPKPRTMKLVISAAGDDLEVSVVKNMEDKYRDAPEVPEPDQNQTEKDTAKGDGSSGSDEYYECSNLDALANGRPAGSGSLNVMARFSNSMVDLRSEDPDPDPDPAERNRLNIQSGREPGKVQQGRPPVRETPNRTRVVVAKPGVYHRLSKSSIHIIGGHKYWSEKLGLAQCDAIRTGRSPGRGSPNRLGGLRFQHSHSPSPRRTNRTQMPLGIPGSKLSSHEHFRGRAAGERVTNRSKES